MVGFPLLHFCCCVRMWLCVIVEDVLMLWLLITWHVHFLFVETHLSAHFSIVVDLVFRQESTKAIQENWAPNEVDAVLRFFELFVDDDDVFF